LLLKRNYASWFYSFDEVDGRHGIRAARTMIANLHRELNKI